jgi:hypothetical protein
MTPPCAARCGSLWARSLSRAYGFVCSKYVTMMTKGLSTFEKELVTKVRRNGNIAPRGIGGG